MDTRTGEIHYFKDEEELKKALEENKDLVELGNSPDKNCKRCFGRGYEGQDIYTKKFIPCQCTSPVLKMFRDIENIN